MSNLKAQSSKISALIAITVIQEEAQVWLQDECKYQFSFTALTETVVLFSSVFSILFVLLECRERNVVTYI